MIFVRRGQKERDLQLAWQLALSFKGSTTLLRICYNVKEILNFNFSCFLVLGTQGEKRRSINYAKNWNYAFPWHTHISHDVFLRCYILTLIHKEYLERGSPLDNRIYTKLRLHLVFVFCSPSERMHLICREWSHDTGLYLKPCRSGFLKLVRERTLGNHL